MASLALVMALRRVIRGRRNLQSAHFQREDFTQTQVLHGSMHERRRAYLLRAKKRQTGNAGDAIFCFNLYIG